MSAAVQAYLRSVVADGHQLLATGPFDVFLQPDSDHAFTNYAIPRDGAEPSPEAVAELIAVMEGSGRLPRLEFLPAVAPAAEQALLDAGFEVELRTPVMSCTPDSLKDLTVPEGVTLHQLAPDAEAEELHGFRRAVSEAFGDPYDASQTQAAAATLLRRVAVLAYADGEIAGGGSCQTVIAGTTELVGIGISERFRRRGIAASVTAELARLVFADGADTAFLTPGSEEAQRIYARAGFEPTDTMLHLVLRR